MIPYLSGDSSRGMLKIGLSYKQTKKFAVDDVAYINIHDVSMFGVKTKKAGIFNGFPLYLPRQSGDPHFSFQILNGYNVSCLLV